MNILIAFATNHGTSEKAAKMLESNLNGNVTFHNFKTRKAPELSAYDAVIVGGSIHAGNIQQKVKSFIQKNEDTLTKKHLGLYLCCMDKEQAQIQFENAYPENLRETAHATSLFGGEFIFEKMNWFEKKIIKKISGVDKTVSQIDNEAINRFAEKFNKLPQ